MQPRGVAGVAGDLRVHGGERLLCRRVHEHPVDPAQSVVAGGAVDGQHRVEQFVGPEDLLDPQDTVVADVGPQTHQVPDGVDETVGVVDADAVDEVLVDELVHHRVGRGVDVAVLLAQPARPLTAKNRR
ncbi:MAG: hypothetical protein PGN29_16135 [Gordonia paraffinivorans]